MAQLKDLIVTGASRFINDVVTNSIQITKLAIPTSSGGSTYGAGTSGQVIKTNGTSIYWATLGAAAAKAVDTSISVGSTSTNLPTSAAVATFVNNLKGTANGIAELDNNGKVLSSQLPSIPSAATATPAMDGTAAVGSSTKYAKEDHVHPSDTTKANINSPSFTGTPTAPNPKATDDSTRIATTAWVNLVTSAIEEAAMKVKIYYVIPGKPSGQGGRWSGQDYASYTLGSCGIYKDSEGTTLISSTQQLITDISNGIIPVLNVIDQYDAYVLCYPNWIEDDLLVVHFIGMATGDNRELLPLEIDVDIDNSIKGIYSGYYLNYGLPTVTSSDNGKFLRVVNGTWATDTVSNASGVSF